MRRAVQGSLNCGGGYALGGGVSGVGAREEWDTSATRPNCPWGIGFNNAVVGWLAVIDTEQEVRT